MRYLNIVTTCLVSVSVSAIPTVPVRDQEGAALADISAVTATTHPTLQPRQQRYANQVKNTRPGGEGSVLPSNLLPPSPGPGFPSGYNTDWNRQTKQEFWKDHNKETKDKIAQVDKYQDKGEANARKAVNELEQALRNARPEDRQNIQTRLDAAKRFQKERARDDKTVDQQWKQHDRLDKQEAKCELGKTCSNGRVNGYNNNNYYNDKNGYRSYSNNNNYNNDKNGYRTYNNYNNYNNDKNGYRTYSNNNNNNNNKYNYNDRNGYKTSNIVNSVPGYGDKGGSVNRNYNSNGSKNSYNSYNSNASKNSHSSNNNGRTWRI